MVSLEVSNSVSTSFYSSQSTSLKSSSSGPEGSSSLRYASHSETLFQASTSSSVSINGDNLDLSSAAAFSFQFSQTTQIAIGQHSEGIFEGFEGNGTSLESFFPERSDNASESQSSLFEPDSLTQQIYESNLALFDDFLSNHGNELTKENVKKFVDLMKQTIPEGFRQARERLNGSDLMNSDDKSTLENVKGRVMDKLEKFKEFMFEKIESGEWTEPDDVVFSELPGVQNDLVSLNNSNGFALAVNIELSIQFMGMNRSRLTREGLNRANGNAQSANEGQSSQSPDKSPGISFDVDSLAQGIFEDNVALFNNFINNRNGQVNQENVKDFVDLMRETIPEGFRQAREKLSGLGLLDRNDGQLDEILGKVMDKLEKFEDSILEKLEKDSGSSEETSTGTEPTEDDSGTANNTENDSQATVPGETLTVERPETSPAEAVESSSEESDDDDNKNSRTDDGDNLKEAAEERRHERPGRGRFMAPRKAAAEALNNASNRSIFA